MNWRRLSRRRPVNRQILNGRRGICYGTLFRLGSVCECMPC